MAMSQEEIHKMMEEVAKRYPLHYLVFTRNHLELEKQLKDLFFHDKLPNVLAQRPHETVQKPGRAKVADKNEDKANGTDDDEDVDGEEDSEKVDDERTGYGNDNDDGMDKTESNAYATPSKTGVKSPKAESRVSSEVASQDNFVHDSNVADGVRKIVVMQPTHVYLKRNTKYCDRQCTKPIVEFGEDKKPIRKGGTVQYFVSGQRVKEEDYDKVFDSNPASDPGSENSSKAESDEGSDDELEKRNSNPSWKTGGGPGESKPLELNVRKEKAVKKSPNKSRHDDMVGTEREQQLRTRRPCDFIEEKDHRGRTPLQLAVTMLHKECVRILLWYNAYIYVLDRNGFNVYHEAITTKDTGLVQMVYRAMERCRIQKILEFVWEYFDGFAAATNFYVEIDCKAKKSVLKGFDDRIQIWKKGSMLRVDSQMSSLHHEAYMDKSDRLGRTMIFIKKEKQSEFYDVDHPTKTYTVHTFEPGLKPHPVTNKLVFSKDDIRNYNQDFPVNSKAVDKMMKRALELITVNTYGSRVKEKKSTWKFHKQQSTYLKSYKCKLFKLKGATRTTKIRREHLDAQFYAPNAHMLQLKMRHQIDALNYFCTKGPADVGLIPKVDTSLDDFTGIIYITQSFPIDFVTQIIPVFKLLYLDKGLLKHLDDFTWIQLPQGFPLKFELDVAAFTAEKYGVTYTFKNPNGLVKRPAGLENPAWMHDDNREKQGQQNRNLRLDDAIFNIRARMDYTERTN